MPKELKPKRVPMRQELRWSRVKIKELELKLDNCNKRLGNIILKNNELRKELSSIKRDYSKKIISLVGEKQKNRDLLVKLTGKNRQPKFLERVYLTIRKWISQVIFIFKR